MAVPSPERYLAKLVNLLQRVRRAARSGGRRVTDHARLVGVEAALTGLRGNRLTVQAVESVRQGRAAGAVAGTAGGRRREAVTALHAAGENCVNQACARRVAAGTAQTGQRGETSIRIRRSICNFSGVDGAY